MTARKSCSTLLFALTLARAAAPAHVAFAADQTILGDMLQVKNPSTADKRKVVGKAKEKASPDIIVGDPTAGGGGATLTITANGGTPSSQTFGLPQGTSPATGKPYWSGDATKGYKYKDPKGENGPIKSAQIKKSGSGVFLIKAIGSGKFATITVLPPNPGTDGCILLQITGGDSYSVRFGLMDGTITNKGAQEYKHKKPLSQATCVTTTTTTTNTWSTSTSTTSSSSSTSSSSTTTTSSSSTTTSSSTTLPQIDHYTVYQAAGPMGPPVLLADQFGPLPEGTLLGNVAFFMPPADKNGEGVHNPGGHLTCYDIAGAPFVAMVDVVNQFGPQSLEVQKPDVLCVPTDKLIDPFPVGLLDHYKCYEASGLPPTVLTVTLVDQFQTQLVSVLNPFLFCNPADKNGEGILDPNGHLTCYQTNPPGLGVGPVAVSNQFDINFGVTVGPAGGLCVPSIKVGWTPLP